MWPWGLLYSRNVLGDVVEHYPQLRPKENMKVELVTPLALILQKSDLKGVTLQSLIDRTWHDESVFIDSENVDLTEEGWTQYLSQYGVDVKDVLANPRIRLISKKSTRVITANRMMFVNSPDILAIKINRIVSGDPKTGKKVNYPAVLPNDEIVYIPFMWKPVAYRLLAIFVHIGVAFRSGHYVTYFRYNEGNQWYYYNDSGPIFEKSNIGSRTTKKTIESGGYFYFLVKQ